MHLHFSCSFCFRKGANIYKMFFEHNTCLLLKISKPSVKNTKEKIRNPCTSHLHHSNFTTATIWDLFWYQNILDFLNVRIYFCLFLYKNSIIIAPGFSLDLTGNEHLQCFPGSNIILNDCTGFLLVAGTIL